MCQHVHLLGFGFDDFGGSLNRHKQQGRETGVIALGKSFQQLLGLGQLLGRPAVVTHVMVCQGEVEEQRCDDGVEVLGLLADVVRQHEQGILGGTK